MRSYIRCFYLLAALLLASFTACFAETAELIYEDYFGDYFLGSRHTLELDLKRESPKSLLQKLVMLNPRAASDLLLVAYGDTDSEEGYFAGTQRMDSGKNFAEEALFTKLARRPQARFYFRFVNPSYSSHAKPGATELSSLSPLAHLPRIAKRIEFF